MRTTVRLDDKLHAETKTLAAETGRTLGASGSQLFAGRACCPESTWIIRRRFSTGWRGRGLMIDVNLLAYAGRTTRALRRGPVLAVALQRRVSRPPAAAGASGEETPAFHQICDPREDSPH